MIENSLKACTKIWNKIILIICKFRMELVFANIRYDLQYCNLDKENRNILGLHLIHYILYTDPYYYQTISQRPDAWSFEKLMVHGAQYLYYELLFLFYLFFESNIEQSYDLLILDIQKYVTPRNFHMQSAVIMKRWWLGRHLNLIQGRLF